MVFNSFEFLIFFVVIFGLYFLVPNGLRWLLLLVGSYFFYMSWEPAYIILIIFSTVIDYFVSHRMVKEERKEQRTRLLWVSIIVNLGLLFAFKYFNFFSENIASLLNVLGIGYKPAVSSLLLPVGISFYTFQTLSYSIDVYRGVLKPEKHFGKFALYVSFFPQLVAGPIERATNLLPQLKKIEYKFNYQDFVCGFSQFVLGLFKKVVVADSAALYVDSIYSFGVYELFSGITLIFATFLFAIQIYCDFSGYSDMAIGVARMMGFKLMENFHLPYFSKSTSEIWRRWHISLGSWANDYVFTPLSMNLARKYRKYGVPLASLITFTLIGFWHGANWTYIVFGIIHGVVMGIENLSRRKRKKIRKSIGDFSFKFSGWFITMVIWLITLVIFRSEDLTQATYILQNFFDSNAMTNLRIQDANVFINIMIGTLVLFLLEFFIFRKNSFEGLTKRKSLFWMASFSSILVVFIILFGVSGGSQFIYFQF